MPATIKAVPPNESGTPMLLNVDQVAGMLNCSSRHVYRLVDTGQMPRPVRLGKLVRWNHDAIESWIHDGCPAPKKTAR